MEQVPGYNELPVCASLLPTSGESSSSRRSDQRPITPPPQPQPPPPPAPPPLPRLISSATITDHCANTQTCPSQHETTVSEPSKPLNRRLLSNSERNCRWPDRRPARAAASFLQMPDVGSRSGDELIEHPLWYSQQTWYFTRDCIRLFIDLMEQGKRSPNS